MSCESADAGQRGRVRREHAMHELPPAGEAMIGAMLRNVFRSAVAASVGLFTCTAFAQAPHAQDPGPPPLTFRIEAIVEGVSPATGLADTVYGMTAYVGAERTRVDLDMPGTEGVYLLVDNATGVGWAIGKEQDAAMPVNADAYR